MSGFGTALGSVGGIVAFLNKLIDLFKSTPVEKEKDVADKVQKENEDVKNGGLPE